MSTPISLESIRIASPCRADWGKMEGDERARFCQTCAKNVYNLSDMSKADAENLIQEKEGDLCVRFYQRADGTIITDNCPVGLKIVQRPFKWLFAGFTTLLLSGMMILLQQSYVSPKLKSITLNQCRSLPVIGVIINRLRPQTFMGAAANQMTN